MLRYASYPCVCGSSVPLAISLCARSLAPRNIGLAAASFSFARAGRLFTTVGILPRGIPSAFESNIHLFSPGYEGGWLQSASYLWVCGFPVPLAVLVGASSLGPRNICLAATSFFVRSGLAVVRNRLILPRGSRAFSRVSSIFSPGQTVAC